MSMRSWWPRGPARHIGRQGEFPARTGVAEHGREAAAPPPAVAAAGSAFRWIPRPGATPYHRLVNTVAVRLARLPQPLAARLAALPPRHQELIQDTGLGVALATVNVVSLLPYRAQLHPLWLALVLAAGQALPLAFRRFRPVGDRPGHRGRAGRLRQDRVRLRAVPAGPAIAFYTIIDRRGTVLALDRLPAGGGGHLDLGGLARPCPAIRHDLPGDDLPHRRGGGPAQPGQAGQHPGRAEPGRPRRGRTRPAIRRRPRSRSGPGSPANCTTWWRTTSA